MCEPEPEAVTVSAQAIATRGLTRSYGSRLAIDSLDLDVEEGSVVGVLGPNGAGKTTAVRLLTTVLRPDHGSFTVAGVPHTKPVEIRRRIGVLPESAGYPEDQTAEEVLVFHARLFGLSPADARREASAVLGEVGLADRAGSFVRGYSRGMRQRLGIARALVSKPAVVFLDEPTLGLDPAGQRHVLDLVAGAARERGVTVLLSTHALAEVEEVCDRVIILNLGRVVAEGSVAEVARRAAAPRRGRVHVPAELVGAAVDALRGVAGLASVERGEQADEIRVELASGVTAEDGSTRVLRCLLDAGVPVTSFEFERGQLSEAFLALTASP